MTLHLPPSLNTNLQLQLDMFGYLSTELIGENVKLLMPQRYAVEHDQHLANVKDDKPLEFTNNRELVGLHKNNIEFPISILLKKEKVAGSDEISAKISKLAENIGIVSINEKGKIKSVNDHVLKLFGYNTKEEIVGHNVSILMPEPYSTFHDAYIQRYLNTGLTRLLGENKGRCVYTYNSRIFYS